MSSAQNTPKISPSPHSEKSKAQRPHPASAGPHVAGDGQVVALHPAGVQLPQLPRHGHPVNRRLVILRLGVHNMVCSRINNVHTFIHLSFQAFLKSSMTLHFKTLRVPCVLRME